MHDLGIFVRYERFVFVYSEGKQKLSNFTTHLRYENIVPHKYHNTRSILCYDIL